LRRVRIGIKGLDDLLQGGVPENNSILICGGPGTGKSIFGLQFIYTGAKNKEPGLYVSIEEKPEKLREQALFFFKDFKKLEDKKLINFLKIPTYTAGFDIVEAIKGAVKKTKAKRIVIDSLSILSINSSMYRIGLKTELPFSSAVITSNNCSSEEIKQMIYIFINKLSELPTTNLFIDDSSEQGMYLTRDAVSEFVCDGVIRLKQLMIGRTVQRVLEIIKMRNTDVKPGAHTLMFTDSGLQIIDFRY